MLRLAKELVLRHCPCSVEFVAAWKLFVVGTYELSEQAGESINGRFGSLVLIAIAGEDGQVAASTERQAAKPDESDELVVALEQDCTNGGVFDFRLLQSDLASVNGSPSDPTARVRLYAAHSNGRLSTYEISKTDHQFRVNEVSSLQTGSAMLTCLDLVEINERESAGVLVIVGDSSSTISLIRDGQVIRRLRIATFDYPVWSIKIRPPVLGDRFLVFTGSDDCVLRCFAFGAAFQDHRQLFTAGERNSPVG